MNNNDIDYSKGKMPKAPLVLSFIIVAFAILYFSKYLEWERKPFSDGNIDESQIHEITDLEDNPVSGQHLTNENAKNLYSKYDFTKVQNYYGDSFKDIYFSNKGISNEYMIYLAILNMLEDDFSKNCKIEKSLSQVDVRNKVNELFGSKPYQDSSFELDGLNVIFDNNVYRIVTSKCTSLDFMSDRIDTEYTSNKVDNGKLVITVYGYLVTFDDGMYNYYKDVTRNSEILGHDIALIDKKNFTKYTLIFGSNSNGTFYLEGFGKEL